MYETTPTKEKKPKKYQIFLPCFKTIADWTLMEWIKDHIKPEKNMLKAVMAYGEEYQLLVTFKTSPLSLSETMPRPVIYLQQNGTEDWQFWGELVPMGEKEDPPTPVLRLGTLLGYVYAKPHQEGNEDKLVFRNECPSPTEFEGELFPPRVLIIVVGGGWWGFGGEGVVLIEVVEKKIEY